MATKDCTFFVDIDGRQVEMDFDGFRAYLMQDGVMATLAPDLTAKRGKKAGFTVTAQKAEATPARAEAAKTTAEPFKVDVGGVEGQGYAFSRQTKASLIENVIKGGEYITDFTVFAVRAAIRPKGLKHVKDAEQTRPAPDIVRDRWENTYIKAAQEPANIVGVWSLNKRIDIALIQSGDMIVPLNARDLKALYELVEFDALKVAKGDPTSPVIALKNGQPVGMTAPFHGDMLEQTYRVTPDKLREAADQIQQTLGTPAESPTARAEASKAKAKTPAPSELEVSAENLRKLMPKLGKRRAEAIIAVMKAMGIPFDRLKLAKGKVEAKETLQQADVKARDAEYMAAVKAGDTAKAQRMVEEAARAAGYTEKAYHATNRQFSIFNADAGRYTYPITSPKAIYFTSSKEEASFWADVKSQSSGQPIVLPVYLRPSISSRYPKPVQRVNAGGVSADQLRVSRTNADMIILENIKEFGGDALVTDYVVFSPNQIKSADPITYDDKGNVIPLSQRFKLESPDIRYQEEASPLGSITFIDDLNALISVFEKANFSTVLHEAMHFYRRHMLNTENGFTAEEIKRFERWAEAKNGNWTVAAEEKAARAFEKYLRDGLAPIPELRDLFRRVAQWMREVYATLTESPVDIDIPADIRQVFDRIFTLEAERQGKAGGQATPAAGTQSLQQADVKARDAEYMAAVKAGDISRAQDLAYDAAMDLAKSLPDSRNTNDIPNLDSIESSGDFTQIGRKEVPSRWFSQKGRYDYYSSSDQQRVAALADSIREEGVRSPLIVVIDGDAKGVAYVLEGNHRQSAIAEVKLDAFPALVVVPEDLEAIVRDDKGNVIPLSQRFKPESPDIRYQEASATPTSAVVEAAKKWAGVSEVTPSLSDAQGKVYAAVYKANESRLLNIAEQYTALTRKMQETMLAQPLDALAKAVPLGSVFVQGARNQPGSTDATIKPKLVDYVMDSLDDALFDWMYEHLAEHTGVPVSQWRQRRDIRDKFTIAEQITAADKQKAGSAQSLRDNKNRFTTGKPFLVQVYHGTSEAGIAGHQFSSGFGGAATGAESATRGFFFAGSQLTSLAYAMDAVPAQGRITAPRVLTFFVKMRNPLVYDMKGVEYRGKSYNDILIQAAEKGHDGVVITNTYDGGPLDNIFVVLHGNEKQIKSADPVTYDDAGKPIPMGKRFQGTADIRYQREGEGVPQAETATAAYRRAMKERQQERAAKALRRLGQKKGEPATLVPAQPRPSLEITPVNRRAVIETMQELREFRKDLDKRGVDIADANEADLEQWEKLLNRVEQLGGVNPITPQMDAAFVRVAQQGATSPDAIRLIEDAAKKAFGISKLVAGNTHTRTIQAPLALDEKQEILKALNRKTTSGQLSLDVQRVLLDRRYDVKGAWARSKNWRQTLEDYLTGNDERFSESQKRELKAYVQDVVNEMRQFTKQVPVKATDVFQTGKPVLASVYRGGDLVGNEFQERFLGLFTGAPSAKMGYFFAGRSETSSNYSSNVQRYVVAMYNPLVFDFKGDRQRVARLSQVIRDAYADGHDGVIAVNIYDPAPIDNVFIIPPGGENRIKSYGLTSREEGLIPLSERFNPTTKNVLYQGEDPLPNPEGTSTEAFRRKQAEQRQKNIMDAMNRLRQGQAQAPKGEPKAAQPKAAKEPSQARQAQTTAPRAAKTAASAPRRGFGGKSLDDIFDALLKQAKAGQLGVSKEAPATPSELLEERIKRGLRDVLDAVYNKRVQPESAVDAARNAAANLLAAHQAGEQSAIDAATAEFRQVVSESRKAARGPQAPRPPRPKATVAERYAKMMGRINEKPKPAAKATPAELAEMTVRQLLRRMEKQLKVAKSQGIDVEQMEVNGATVSRKEFFVNAADEYQDAYVKQDIPRQQAAYDRMRMAVDTIVTSLQKGKSRPNWHGLRSPLSYANVIGSYEAIMGQLGAEISELFKRTRTDINNKVMTFSEGMSFLQEQMNKVYKPLMKAQGYYGMPAIIDEHIKYLRFTAAFSARYTKIRKEQSIFKDPKAWYTTRRELSRELIDGQSAAFPMAAAMIKSVVYTAKLKYNLKSASTNYISLALSVGPYMRANELADIIYEAAKPSTWNRKVAGDRTLRDVAVGETGGRQAEGAPADEGLTHWWHRKDIFQLSSEHVRIAGYLVGERMAEREDQKLRAEGKAPLSDYVKARLIRDWIEKVEFDNSPWNIAPLFRGPVASVAFQFKPFLQKNVERFIADLQRDPEAFVLSDPRTPLGQITSKIPWKYRRVIGTIGQQVMWGGIGSLLTAVPYLKPLAGVFILAGLMNALKGMTDDDEFAEDLAVAIYYGAPAAIGTDLSSSVGFFEEPYGKTVHEQAVNFFLGPLASTALNVVQEDIKFLETAQKEPRLGGEEEKRKEMLRRGINIAKQVTPYVRMLESAVDLAQGEGSTMRLDKEEELTKWETAIRALGGAPLKQTMFFDEKEAYGWQKSLLGKPTGFERLKKKEGESDASYFRRKAKTDQWERTYLRRLEQNPRYRRLKPEEQEAVRENLWRNFAEESGKLRPDTSKFDASGLLERRAERVRSR